MALTIKGIPRLRVGQRHHDEHGLYLNKRSKRSAAWEYRYQFDLKEYFLGLGPLHTIDLYEARERARNERKLLIDGINPKAAKDAERAARKVAQVKTILFKIAAETHFKEQEPKYKNAKAGAQVLSSLRAYAFPVLGNLPVAEIDSALVLAALRPIWFTKTETAGRVRQRIEAVLSWAIAHGYRSGPNPASREVIAAALPSRASIAPVEHFAALPFAELPGFVLELRKREAISARALEFLILTATRTNETVGARWSEMDLESAMWTIPAARMKGRKGKSREHRVPLSPAAIALLQSLPRETGNDFVFIGPEEGEPMSGAAMAALLDRMGIESSRATVHGMRSTFRDWSAECTAYPNIVCEMALAHAIDDKTEKAYRRGDLFAKRARLMRDWAKYCYSTPAKGNNIRAIRAA